MNPMPESAEFRRHLALQTRCMHPQGGWIGSREEIDQSIPARFEKIVAKYPDHPAVKTKDGDLTYRELYESANRLAHSIIRARGPAAEPVGILVDHGVSGILAMLAVLKSGKFYVPLDPHYPLDRLRYMLDDTNATLIVTDQSHHTMARELVGVNMLILTTPECTAEPLEEFPALPLGPEAIAAIYYTSGSTGRPKGIVYTHGYLLHNMKNYGNTFRISRHDRWTWLHSCGFSPASTDIFCPLLHGATVCPWDVQDDGFTGLGEWLDDMGITVLHWMATPFLTFAATLDQVRTFCGVRLMIFGGEKLLTRDVRSFEKFFAPACIFANRLGASEAGLYQVYFFGRETPLYESSVPAGYAISEKAAIILDETGAELPLGAIGEIGVRSQYLPPRYWRQPELTRQKYRKFRNETGTRMYLTGDLGRYRADGCLEYHGRKDSQIKIRGNRVETDEVENVVLELHGIVETIVVARKLPSGDGAMTCYFVAAPETKLDKATVRRYLTGKLPAFMIPASFVQLDKLPRNINQKIDVAAMPFPDVTFDQTPGKNAPTHNPLQQILIESWEKILEVAPIGLDDDFFELGGDSLKAMRIVSRLQPLLASKLHILPVFDNPTISSFSEFLQSNYGQELRQQLLGNGSMEVDPGRMSLDPLKLDSVRAAIAAFPTSGRTSNQTDHKNPSAIFILAPPRSGTTLMRVMLAGHPRLFAPPELHLLSHENMDQRQGVLTHLMHHRRLDGLIEALMRARKCTLEEAECTIHNYEAAGLPVKEMYLELQKRIAPRRLVDKTPFYAFHRDVLDRVEQIFAEPLYIHLARHPYGMILSYEEMRLDQISLVRRPPDVSVRGFSEAIWLICHENILQFLAEIPARRQMRMSYEDLVEDPPQAVSQLCQFLNLDVHAGMLDPYEEKQQRMTAGLRPLTEMVGDPKFHQHKSINSAIADRWQEVYREDFLCAETWTLAEQLGYSRR